MKFSKLFDSPYFPLFTIDSSFLFFFSHLEYDVRKGTTLVRGVPQLQGRCGVHPGKRRRTLRGLPLTGAQLRSKTYERATKA